LRAEHVTALGSLLSGPAPTLAAADGPMGRWRLDADSGIVWDVARDTRLPHSDHIEMSGRLVSVILRYEVDAERRLRLERTVVYPTLRTIPNDTHASLQQAYGAEVEPHIRANGGAVMPMHVDDVAIDGVVTFSGRTDEGLAIRRTAFPAFRQRCAIELFDLLNDSRDSLTIEVDPVRDDTEREGVYGRYALQAATTWSGTRVLGPGEGCSFALAFTGRLAADAPVEVDADRELRTRREFVAGLLGALRLESPNPVLDRAFDFAKVRAAESVFETKGGLMHSPGGYAYYAAIWANDQAEYVGPFFPFLGDRGGNEATLHCYRLFARYMGPDYKAIPSSIIAEGVDTWAGAGDRGDAAMVAYGAARYALALGDHAIAEELSQTIEWALEYCRRQKTPEGVITSDSDELEGRFPSGDANLNTSALTYGGLCSAAHLARSLGRPETAEAYDREADALHGAIERHFGADVEGFHTYGYYDGNTVLRAWICVPLTMGILDRRGGTIAALFSPRLWTEDGLATEAGDATFWDRATLYALRGVFAAGETDAALRYLTAYSRRRLLGEHVPYAVEAYPEGGQRHLSAESALYCRVITEGLFGITPTGLDSFECAPRLPTGWDRMALRSVRAFAREFDLAAERSPDGVVVSVESGGQQVWRAVWDGAAPLAVPLSGLAPHPSPLGRRPG